MSVKTAFIAFESWLGQSKGWHLRTGLLCLVACLLFSAGPSFTRFPYFGGSNFSEAYFQKYAHPLTPSRAVPGSHDSKLTFRLTVPVLAHLLGFDRLGTFVLLGLCGVGWSFLIPVLALRAIPERVLAGWFSLLVMGLHPTALFFSPVTGYFDGVAFLLLAAALASRHFLLTYAFILLAAFTDERALLASAFVPIYHCCCAWQKSRPFSFRDLFRTSWIWSAITAWLSYGVIREYLGWRFNLTPDFGGIVWQTFRLDLPLMPFAMLCSLKTGWFFVLAAPIFADKPSRPFCWLAALVLGLCAVGSSFVYDMTRSYSYAFPVLFIALAVQGRQLANPVGRSWVAIAALGSLVLPNYEVIGVSTIIAIHPWPWTLFGDCSHFFRLLFG